MTTNPVTIVRDLRALMPARQLTMTEARQIAERQANRLLALLDITEGAVDLTALTELPRIEVRVDARLARLGISGLSESHRGGGWVVTINKADSLTRRRFSLGHEFKHVLDHPFAKLLYPFAADQANPTAELVCDYFSACLLMPKAWITRLWSGGLQDVAELAVRFRVSPSAMARRLQDLELIEHSSRHRAADHFEVARYFRAAPNVCPQAV